MHRVHSFEQPLLLWAVIAVLRARPGWAEVGCGSCRAGPQNGLEIASQAETFPPVHISTLYAFAVCCHSNETRALIANPPNSVQL